MSDNLTHLNDRGEARMVDVSAKPVTARTATASGLVTTTREVLDRLSRGDLPKGDVLAVARIAGIQAVKKTPDLIPLAHPVAVHGVEVDVRVGERGIDLSATVTTADRTGIEMEALTAVAVAGLATIDMIKGLDRAARIEYVQVEHKSGGKSGEFRRAADADAGSAPDAAPDVGRERNVSPAPDVSTAPDPGNRAGAGTEVPRP